MRLVPLGGWRTEKMKKRFLVLTTMILAAVSCLASSVWALTKGEEGGDSTEVKIEETEYTFRWCPPGQVKMFAVAEENDPESQKKFKIVDVTEGFWMLQSEVTRGLWKSVMGKDPSKSPIPSAEAANSDNFPVDSVTWDDCQEFVKKLNDKFSVSGYKFALPSEVQWVYASRAGDLKDKDETFDSLAWFADNSENRPHEICTKSPNDWGLYDMHGNVAEWSLDWYDEKTYKENDAEESNAANKKRGYHGGSYMMNEEYYNQDSRFFLDKDTINPDLGFRVCLVPDSGF